MKDLQDLLKHCLLCPRKCGVNRLEGKTGFCKTGSDPKVALASLHSWEEPCISGTSGSGTIFFSHCNLHCIFCQNYEISQYGQGKTISITRLSRIFLEQQQRGAHNINLVTPVHFVPQIIPAVAAAKKQGLRLPIIYNTNSYENTNTINLLKGTIDIYLPDLKYYSDTYADRFSAAPQYFKYAAKAIEAMVEQVGPTVFDEQGLMQKGVLIRHLALPGLYEDSCKILDYIYQTFGNSVYVSIMNQYTPMYLAKQHKDLRHKLSRHSYEKLVDYAVSLGIENGFIQDDSAAVESYTPNFDLRGV